ncbi:hypothetical protein D3C81_1936470 [compost metagenome]
MVRAAAWPTWLPAPVEPVNDTMSTSGWLDMASPITRPGPLTRLNTPLGTPALCNTSVSKIALIGELTLGLETTVQPAAKA